MRKKTGNVKVITILVFGVFAFLIQLPTTQASGRFLREMPVKTMEAGDIKDISPRENAETPASKENSSDQQEQKIIQDISSPRQDAVTIVDLTTKLTHEEALLLYQGMVEALPERAKSTFQILLELMKKGRMPVFYPGPKVVGGQYFGALQFNPRSVITLDEKEFKGCSKRSWSTIARADWGSDCLTKQQCPSVSETGVFIGNDKGNKIVCFSGNFLYVLGRGANEVTHSYGNSIIQSEAGDDVINLGGEASILVFSKNWGKDTVTLGNMYPKWLDLIKDSPAKEDWKKAGFKYQQFIVFGPGIYPQDLQWESYTYNHISGKSPIVLKNIKTGDQLTFKSWPRLNFVFYEDGKFEEWSAFGERESKRRTDEARQRIEDLKIPQRFGERLKNCGLEKNCYLSLARDVARDVDDPRQRCEIENAIVLAKFKADGAISVQEAVSFARGDIASSIEDGIDKPDPCQYNNIGLALEMAKSGQTEEALKRAFMDNGGALSRLTVGRTKVVKEVIGHLIQKKKYTDALNVAFNFLAEHYAAASADLLLVVDPDFYRLMAGLDYRERLRQALPSQADLFTEDKDLRRRGEKLFRLLLLVAFDDKNFASFDAFMPSTIGADTKGALYFMVAAQMAYAKKEEQLTFFLKRAIEQSNRVSHLGRMRTLLGNTYLPLMLGDRKEEVFAIAHILKTNPEALYALSLVSAGAQLLKAKNIKMAEDTLRKANGFLPQAGAAQSYAVDFREVHARFTKDVVEYILLDQRNVGKAEAIFRESQNANPQIRGDELNKLLAIFYAQEEVGKSFSAAEAIVNVKDKFRAYQAIASSAERKNDKKVLDKALVEAGALFKNFSEAERSFLITNLHMSALAEEGRSYALAELLVSIGEEKYRDRAYEQIALSAAKDKKIARAIQNVDLISSAEARILAKDRVAEVFASNGLSEEALRISTSGDRSKLQLVVQWSKTRTMEARELASRIKDPHIFALAALIISENLE